jgi:hypothetical protein
MLPSEKHILTRHLVANLEKSDMLMRFHLEKYQVVLFDKATILN